MDKGISVIIPVKTPEPYLETLCKHIRGYLIDVPYEILLQYEPGFTNAIIKGVERSQFSFIAVMDADGSHVPLFLKKMYSILISVSNVDMVIGSKNVEGAKDCSPFHRRVISKVYRCLTRFLLGLNLSDPMTGYVMGKREWFAKIDSFTEYKYLLQIFCMVPPPNVVEIPIYFLKRRGGKSKASWRIGFKALKTIFVLWWKKR